MLWLTTGPATATAIQKLGLLQAGDDLPLTLGAGVLSLLSVVVTGLLSYLGQRTSTRRQAETSGEVQRGIDLEAGYKRLEGEVKYYQSVLERERQEWRDRIEDVENAHRRERDDWLADNLEKERRIRELGG